MIKGIIFALCVAASLAHDLPETQFDAHWKRECPRNHQITRVRSRHSNHHEDRAFIFTCRPSHAALKDHHWTHDWTTYDANVNFECRPNAVITGLESIHDNNTEDRIFKFRCSVLDHGHTGSCEWSPWSNVLDGVMDITLPVHKVLTGIQSVHDNATEDRRFKVRLCNYQ
ncbi:millepora cytotoxin-1-like [Lineus longissimus]|uniref:millepora cytotoxin-1-like n=1 Tax=Lineus longissimus TaxID=88925 RepID=UPI00315DB973